MRETVVLLMHDRMQKDINEQFWAVATVSGMSAFLLVNREELVSELSSKAILFGFGVVVAYALFFILHRHNRYHRRRCELIDFLKAEDVPASLRQNRNRWFGVALLGVGFYVGWIVLMTVGVIFTYT